MTIFAVLAASSCVALHTGRTGLVPDFATLRDRARMRWRECACRGAKVRCGCGRAG
jgi:hypothetical protein